MPGPHGFSILGRGRFALGRTRRGARAAFFDSSSISLSLRPENGRFDTTPSMTVNWTRLGIGCNDQERGTRWMALASFQRGSFRPRCDRHRAWRAHSSETAQRRQATETKATETLLPVPPSLWPKQRTHDSADPVACTPLPGTRSDRRQWPLPAREIVIGGVPSGSSALGVSSNQSWITKSCPTRYSLTASRASPARSMSGGRT